MNIGKVIYDFVKCDSTNGCYECEAYKKIDDSGHTCCQLLSQYKLKLQDKINEVIEKN